MIDQNEVQQLLGATLHGADGEKIGRAGQVYLDDQTGRPEWVTVHTGLFGTRETFVPLAEAQLSADDSLVVPYSKDQVKDAPSVDPDGGHLSQSEEAELYRYYGLDYSEARSDSGLPEQDGVAGGVDRSGYDVDRDRDADAPRTAVGHDTSGPTTDDAMTRSEERLNVGTEREAVGRARLRKYVVTENVTQTVPVTREEVRVEREPITEGNADRALAGPDISEEEHEVTLHAERPVVEKETVPVERVRLEKDTVTEHETVSDEVRKEKIETDGDALR